MAEQIVIGDPARNPDMSVLDMYTPEEAGDRREWNAMVYNHYRRASAQVHGVKKTG